MSSVWMEAPGPGAVARAAIGSAAHIRQIEASAYLDLLPHWSVLGLIESAAAAMPDKTAIVAADAQDPTRVQGRVRYGELAALVRGAANRLHEVSAGAAPVVSVLTPLLPEAFILCWAGATAGVSNPINPFLRIDHVAGIMRAAGTTVLVCGSPAHGAGAWNEVDRLRALVPSLRAIWVVGPADSDDSVLRQVAAAPDDRLNFDRPDDPERTSTLLHTGGTTSAPKLVRLSERGQLLNAWCCGAFNGSGREEVVAGGLPYFHVGGATAQALCAMVFGQTLVIVGPEGYRSPRVITQFWDMVTAHGITHVGSAPTTAAALVATHAPRRPPGNFSYWSGGSAVPVQTAREFAAKFDVPIREVWGMTELQGALIGNPRGLEPRLGSAGLTFPYHRACCLPLGATRVAQALEPGTLGALVVSGPCVTEGYVPAERDAGLFFESGDPEERWLNTGDLGLIDADGYVWLRGRSKDLIIRGAHNIDPLLIESTLTEHPAVLHAAAVGEPDRDKGEMPVAYVQLRPQAHATEAELLDHCRRGLSERAAVPRTVRVLESMPLTAVGKIYKPALRLDATRCCVRAVLLALGLEAKVEAEVRERGGALVVVLRAADRSGTGATDAVRRELERFTFQVEVESALAGS